MNIKKAAKVSAIAVAAVSAVGIGAVSYAQWDSANKSVSAEVTMGTVSLVGFTADDLTVTPSGSLVPYNQTGVINGEKVVSIALPKYEASADYTITVSQTGTVQGVFYACISDGAAAAAPEALTADWKEVTAEFSYEIDEYTASITGKYLNIILDSSINADMGQKATFTVTLAVKTAVTE